MIISFLTGTMLVYDSWIKYLTKWKKNKTYQPFLWSVYIFIMTFCLVWASSGLEKF